MVHLVRNLRAKRHAPTPSFAQPRRNTHHRDTQPPRRQSEHAATHAAALAATPLRAAVPSPHHPAAAAAAQKASLHTAQHTTPAPRFRPIAASRDSVAGAQLRAHPLQPRLSIADSSDATRQAVEPPHLLMYPATAATAASWPTAAAGELPTPASTVAPPTAPTPAAIPLPADSACCSTPSLASAQGVISAGEATLEARRGASTALALWKSSLEAEREVELRRRSGRLASRFARRRGLLRWKRLRIDAATREAAMLRSVCEWRMETLLASPSSSPLQRGRQLVKRWAQPLLDKTFKLWKAHVFDGGLSIQTLESLAALRWQRRAVAGAVRQWRLRDARSQRILTNVRRMLLRKALARLFQGAVRSRIIARLISMVPHAHFEFQLLRAMRRWYSLARRRRVLHDSARALTQLSFRGAVEPALGSWRAYVEAFSAKSRMAHAVRQRLLKMRAIAHFRRWTTSCANVKAGASVATFSSRLFRQTLLRAALRAVQQAANVRMRIFRSMLTGDTKAKRWAILTWRTSNSTSALTVRLLLEAQARRRRRFAVAAFMSLRANTISQTNRDAIETLAASFSPRVGVASAFGHWAQRIKAVLAARRLDMSSRRGILYNVLRWWRDTAAQQRDQLALLFTAVSRMRAAEMHHAFDHWEQVASEARVHERARSAIGAAFAARGLGFAFVAWRATVAALARAKRLLAWSIKSLQGAQLRAAFRHFTHLCRAEAQGFALLRRAGISLLHAHVAAAFRTLEEISKARAHALRLLKHVSRIWTRRASTRAFRQLQAYGAARAVASRVALRVVMGARVRAFERLVEYSRSSQRAQSALACLRFAAEGAAFRRFVEYAREWGIFSRAALRLRRARKNSAFMRIAAYSRQSRLVVGAARSLRHARELAAFRKLEECTCSLARSWQLMRDAALSLLHARKRAALRRLEEAVRAKRKVADACARLRRRRSDKRPLEMLEYALSDWLEYSSVHRALAHAVKRIHCTSMVPAFNQWSHQRAESATFARLRDHVAKALGARGRHFAFAAWRAHARTLAHSLQMLRSSVICMRTRALTHGFTTLVQSGKSKRALAGVARMLDERRRATLLFDGFATLRRRTESLIASLAVLQAVLGRTRSLERARAFQTWLEIWRAGSDLARLKLLLARALVSRSVTFALEQWRDAAAMRREQLALMRAVARSILPASACFGRWRRVCAQRRENLALLRRAAGRLAQQRLVATWDRWLASAKAEHVTAVLRAGFGAVLNRQRSRLLREGVASFSAFRARADLRRRHRAHSRSRLRRAALRRMCAGTKGEERRKALRLSSAAHWVMQGAARALRAWQERYAEWLLYDCAIRQWRRCVFLGVMRKWSRFVTRTRLDEERKLVERREERRHQWLRAAFGEWAEVARAERERQRDPLAAYARFNTSLRLPPPGVDASALALLLDQFEHERAAQHAALAERAAAEAQRAHLRLEHARVVAEAARRDAAAAAAIVDQRMPAGLPLLPPPQAHPRMQIYAPPGVSSTMREQEYAASVTPAALRHAPRVYASRRGWREPSQMAQSTRRHIDRGALGGAAKAAATWMRASGLPARRQSAL